MKTIYLHVGLHKTATTSLQTFFHLNQKKLAEAGICYPLTGISEGGAHHRLFSAVRKIVHPDYPNEMSFESYLGVINNEIKSFGKVLFSSEILSEVINYEKLTLIRKLGKAVKIIIYVRPQLETIVSQYAHYIRESSLTIPIQEFQFDIPEYNLDLKETILKWAGMFGFENIIVRPFEECQFFGGSIFSDFLNTLGLSIDSAYFIPKIKINVSLSRNELEFKRLVNWLGNCRSLIPVLDKISRNNMCEEQSGKYDFFSVEEQKNIIEKYSRSNAYIAEKFLSSHALFIQNHPKSDINPYPGLQPENVSEILDFMYLNYREVFDELYKLISLGIKSDELERYQAAKLLKEAYRMGISFQSVNPEKKDNSNWVLRMIYNAFGRKKSEEKRNELT